MALNDLIKQQKATGSYISRFLTNLRKIGAEKLTLDVYETRLELLESYWDKFNSRHDEVVTCAGFFNTDYAQKDIYSSVEEDYLTAKCYIKEQLRIGSSAIAEPKSARKPVAKLPKIVLPVFSGNYLEWESFRDLFRAAVHENKDLSDATRLQYLKTQLSGEAAKIVSNIPITDANYQGAWEALTDRYDNPRVLLHHHLNRLLALRSVSPESPSALKELLDVTNETRRALENMKRPVEHWDDWFVHLTVRKLDSSSRKDWEISLGHRPELPSFDELNAFLLNRIHALESVLTSNSPATSKRLRFFPPKALNSNATKVNKPQLPKGCAYCNEGHYIGYCSKFKALSPQKRKEETIRFKLCSNCLRQHPSGSCPSPNRCFSCSESHHTLLHDDSSTNTLSPESIIFNAHSRTEAPSGCTLLATAIVKAHGPNGRCVIARALFDQGSEASFISENLVQRLRLPRHTVNVPVVGIGGSQCGTAKFQVTLCLSSLFEEYNATLDTKAFVLPNLLKTFSPCQTSFADWPHIRHLKLADNSSYKTLGIDLVIGADLYGYALLEGVIKGSLGTPTAQHTIFGWILSGPVGKYQGRSEESIHPTNNFHCCVDLNLTEDLKHFWELEEIPAQRHLSPNDEFCEHHFTTTHSRADDGKFVVRLPRNPNTSLGDSLTSAKRHFQISERRRYRNLSLKKCYDDFMKEYLSLGHMKMASTDDSVPTHETYYLPHHPVWKREGTSSKIRVVFNASAPSSTGRSLNDCLLPGPKLQQDLSFVLMRWRRHAIVFATDIVKMYRQIWVHPEDRSLQRILWRFSQTEEIKTFELTTVTYGVNCAPFLAIRCLQELATEQQNKYPEAAHVIQNQMYVDDVLSGAETVDDALQLRQQLEDLLMAGGFQLAKWSSNVAEFSTNSECTHFLPDGSVKTLGILWNPKTDTFGFETTLDQPHKFNKRSVLSSISRLFDPLGWLAPVIITGKIFMQDLWLQKIDWDSPLPEDFEKSWRLYYEDLQHLQKLEIPRWLHLNSTSTWALHGFCDASTRAYAAALYVTVHDSQTGIYHSNLLIAKSKVAPVKVVSLPRLELCGAVLLTRLISYVQGAFGNPSVKIYAWTDSQVVLSWLKEHPSRWKTFVANRVSEIHRTVPNAIWGHVPSAENAADPASRGVSVTNLLNLSLWWQGPRWLSESPACWPQSSVFTPASETFSEENVCVKSLAITVCQPWNLLNRYSSLLRLLRVTAYLFRFLKNLRLSKEDRSFEPLTPAEILNSHNYWVRAVQSQYYGEEINLLRNGKPLPPRYSLCRLHPFLDSSDLLRVGGRLGNASISYDEKHPILLPAKSNLSELIVRDAHIRTLHGGPQLTLAQLSSRYWIVRGRNLVRQIIRKCVVCFRYSVQSKPPLMGQLPPQRVTPSRPFLHTGLDYAGPIRLRISRGRGHKACKGYIALFVCMATKAIHLEAVSDCSSDAFLAAFKRFSARRGVPATLFSDQATNFRGADAQLKLLFDAASKENRDISTSLANDGTHWRFIPPHSPHFGGIWESGIKSVKHHLKRVIGETLLTYEELSTVLSEIEACLNSRPLTPLRSDPKDYSVLTPAHFLIGTSLKTIPEPSLLSENINRLSRWQLLRRLYENFWNRWSSEYLRQLQQRSKWHQENPNLQTDDLVLIKEDNTPPSKWCLGRILETHPGNDGVVRVVTVRTSTSTLRRPAVKIYKLPVQ